MLSFDGSKQGLLTRDQLNEELRKHLKTSGIEVGAGILLSHSLRRGGTCAYLAAGVPKEQVQYFGRWHSEGGFETYTSFWSHVISSFQAKAFTQVCDFEIR